MNYKTILAVTDLSKSGNEAVHRAATVAVNCAAELRLMYAPIEDEPAWPHWESHLRDLARTVAATAGHLHGEPGRCGNSVEDIAAEANCADLMVSMYRRERQIGTFFKGEWHQRVIRLTRCPLLLTRSNGRLPYAKIVVPVDFSETSPQLVVHAGRIDDRADLELFHAISRKDEARLRSTDVSWEVVKTFRSHEENHARQRLHELAQATDVGGRTLTLSTGSGEPGRQTSMKQQDSGAALIVVGKARRSAAMDFLCGAVSSRILAWSSADVLIVPHDQRSSTRAAAKRRIAAEMGDGQGAFLSRSAGRLLRWSAAPR